MPILFLILALTIFGFHWMFQKKRSSHKTWELLLGYLMLFSYGFGGVANWIAHVFFANYTATLIGWGVGSPFQFEVGIANLSFGVIAIMSFWLRRSFLFAALLANTIWLWGDAIGHLMNMVKAQNFASGNAGIYFWADVFIPLFIGWVFVMREKSRLSLS